MSGGPDRGNRSDFVLIDVLEAEHDGEDPLVHRTEHQRLPDGDTASLSAGRAPQCQRHETAAASAAGFEAMTTGGSP